MNPYYATFLREVNFFTFNGKNKMGYNHQRQHGIYEVSYPFIFLLHYCSDSSYYTKVNLRIKYEINYSYLNYCGHLPEVL